METAHTVAAQQGKKDKMQLLANTLYIRFRATLNFQKCLGGSEPHVQIILKLCQKRNKDVQFVFLENSD